MYVNFYFDISYALSFLRLFAFYRKVHIQKGILVLYKVPVTIKKLIFLFDTSCEKQKTKSIPFLCLK